MLLLVAGTAYADGWYTAVRFGGMSSYWLHPYWYNYDD